VACSIILCTYLVGGFIEALPDLTASEQDIVAEGDTVAVRYIVEATHKGDLLGIPATGRRVRWDLDLGDHDPLAQEG
jgi:predicted ester cyclase